MKGMDDGRGGMQGVVRLTTKRRGKGVNIIQRKYKVTKRAEGKKTMMGCPMIVVVQCNRWEMHYPLCSHSDEEVKRGA